MDGVALLLIFALAIGVAIAYRQGVVRGRREGQAVTAAPTHPLAAAVPPSETLPQPQIPPPVIATPEAADFSYERARFIRSLEAETAMLRRLACCDAAQNTHLRALADERRRLFGELADARADAARYRDIVVDLENNAMPPLLDGANMIDDLKLIVGVGPVLERMLHQLGITTYRQIARWTERDIDEFDAKLPEFPGRIRRDAWVTQARSLHQSKFGESPLTR